MISNYDVLSFLRANTQLVEKKSGIYMGHLQIFHCDEKYNLTHELNKAIENARKNLEIEEIEYEFITSSEYVNYDGDFDFISMAQSPDFTPASGDFILDIFKEYIIDI